MRLPELQGIQTMVSDLNVFNGINDNVYIPEGSFKDMKNMSSDYYPALGQRKNREKYVISGNMNGAITVNDVLYSCIGTKMYKDGSEIQSVTLEDSQKQMIGYGAYIIIMPDKLMYNTADGKLTKMTYTRKLGKKTSANTMPYLYLSDKDGNPYAVMPATADNAPTSKTQGDKTIKDFQNSLTKGKDIPVFVQNKNVKVLWGTPSILKQYVSDAGSESLGLITTNSNQDLSIKYWDANNSMWSSPTLYVTWWFRTTAETATEIGHAIKSGDFISLKLTDTDGNDMAESSNPDYLYKIWKFFNSYAKVEKVLKYDTEVGLVFSNTGIDFLKYYAKVYKDNISKGTLVTNATTTKDKDPGIITVTNELLRADFPIAGTFPNLEIKKEMPDMKYITVSENRLWGCSNDKHEIYACRQGDPTNWYAYAGLSNDAYAVTIGSDGDFTGSCTYKGMPYFFKEKLIICMYGTRPSNYQLSEIYYPGIEKGSSDSIFFLGGVMYFKSRQGIVRFDGSSTQLISEELGKKEFKNAIACAGDEKYFVAMEENGTNILFAYDSKKQLWHKEDDLHPDFFFKVGTSVFAVQRGEESVIYRIDGSDSLNIKYRSKGFEIPETERIDNMTVHNSGVEWYAQTGFIESGNVGSKYIQRIGLRYEMEDNAEICVKVRYDNEEQWQEIYNHRGRKNEGAVSIGFRPRRCEKFALRFEGSGKCLIHDIRRITYEGSDMNNGNF